jgi:PAS domain S-box-containing protein
MTAPSAVPETLALPTVWIVDDSPLERALALKSLGSGFTTRVFTDGSELLEQIGTQPMPDVIVLDWMMPGISGIDVCKFLNSSDTTRHVSILLVTSQSTPEQVIEALAAGASDYLHKPYAAPLLLARVESLVDARRALAKGEEHAAAVEALRKSKLRYRALIEGLPDLVFVSCQEKIVFMNPRALDVFANGDTERVIGMPVQTLIHPDDADAALRRLAAVSAGQARPLVERRMLRHDGSHMVAELSSQAVVFDGQLAVVSVARDISQQKDAQSQLIVSDRMASVGMLAAGVAHEINNPLACILANLDYALEELKVLGAEGVAGDIAQSLHEARESGARVRQIVRDLKIFSRSDDAERQGPVDVEAVLESSLRMAWNEIRHRARLVKDYGTVSLVRANDARLGQVFLNLMVNAAQAIPEGRAEKNEIRIATRMIDGRVAIEVRDTGAGIAPEALAKLFTPFFTTKPVGSGTGLGLSICHRLVEAIGGEIRVQSQLGKGTTFTVLLPVTEDEEVPAVEAPVLAAAARRGTILVIDDEVMVGKAIQRTLRRDHDVVVVVSANLALEQIQSGQTFDVILCDLMMPQMTGMDLHAHLLEVAPAQANRIVFLSGGAFTSSSRAFLDRISNQRIDKPFDAQQLRGIVNDRVLASAA